MNTTIKQVSKPKGNAKPNKGLPEEAVKFAKQMGINLSGMEAEVNNT
jgi:hypothetical protein